MPADSDALQQAAEAIAAASLSRSCGGRGCAIQPHGCPLLSIHAQRHRQLLGVLLARMRHISKQEATHRMLVTAGGVGG